MSLTHSEETAAPTAFIVRQVGGQLYLSLHDATELGGLSHIDTVDGDVSYCMPLIPDVEVQAWLSTLSIGGEVINRCP